MNRKRMMVLHNGSNWKACAETKSLGKTFNGGAQPAL
jgi:hypothetical protein